MGISITNTLVDSFCWHLKQRIWPFFGQLKMSLRHAEVVHSGHFGSYLSTDSFFFQVIFYYKSKSVKTLFFSLWGFFILIPSLNQLTSEDSYIL